MTNSKYTPGNSAFAVFLTSDSYLSGTLLLYRSIKRYSKFPLVVVIVPDLTPKSTIQILRDEGIKIHSVSGVLIPKAPMAQNLIAERFRYNWTKLRLFEMTEYERLIAIDADMLLFKDMDELFNIDIPSDWIAAVHGCLCNKERASWAPPGWTEINCPFTPLKHPGALIQPVPSTGVDIREEYHELNGGLVIFQPSNEMFTKIQEFLDSSPYIATMNFAEQDVLIRFFRDRWKALGWQYNALKTMRSWHEPIWREEEIRNLHYIVDKPWDRLPEFAGEHEVTESWWWDSWREWEKETDATTVQKVKKTMKAFKPSEQIPN